MKRIIVEDSVSKHRSNNVPKLVEEVKTKTGKVGTVGKLTDNVFFKIIKKGFIIF